MATSKLKLARPTPAGPVIPISQPSPRSSVLWTPALLRSVLRRADGGDLSLVADLCDQIVADDRFGELLAQLADDVIGCDLSFEASLRSVIGNAEKFYEIAEDWPIGYDDDELKNLLVWTMVTGVGFAKHEAWIETPSGRIVPALKWWHPQHFAYMPRGGQFATATIGGDLRNHCWHVKEPGTGNWKPISAGDGTWVIITRRSEYTPWRHGLWRPLAVWWLLKQYAMQDSGVHTEKASKTVVASNADSTEAQRREVAQYVYDAAKDAVVVLPDGWTLDIKEIQANLDTLYHSQIRLANESAAVTILGQNLSTNVEGGSYAAAREHGAKESRRVRNAAQMLTKNLHSQSLVWWAEFNFGNKSLAPYPRWHTEPQADFAAKADVLQKFATAALTMKTAGWEIDEEFVEEELGIPAKKTKALVAREQAEPGDTDGDGIPHNEPGNPTAPLPGGADPKKTVEPPRADPPRARPARPSKAGAITALASGDSPAEAAGFVRGQIYADALTDKTTTLVAGELSGFLDKITAAINGAETYEDVRYAVIKAFQGQADPTAMAKIIEHALLLSNLAGRYAVQEDTPEDDESLEAFDAKYNPKQPRHPRGTPQGGQWSGGKGGVPVGGGGGGGGTAPADPAPTPASGPPSARLGIAGEQVFGKKLTDAELDEIAGVNANLPDGHKINVRIRQSGVHDDEPLVIINGSIVNKSGAEIGTFKREYRNADGKTVVRHEEFFLDAGSQGSGIGKSVFNAQIDAYQKHGFDKVSLEAAEVGKYVWTKAGFEWGNQRQIAEMRGKFEQHLQSQYGAAAATKIMSSVRTPNDIARVTVGGDRVGKNFLINASDQIEMSQSPSKIKRL